MMLLKNKQSVCQKHTIYLFYLARFKSLHLFSPSKVHVAVPALSSLLVLRVRFSHQPFV